MKIYLKKLRKRILFGLVLGLAIGYSVLFINGLFGNTVTIDPKSIITNYIASMVVGMWCSGISIVFEIDEWSSLKQTIIHSILLAPYLPFSFYMGWAPPTVKGRVLFVIVYFIIYFIIWISFKIYWTTKAKELNKELERINK